jgi:C4-dicarboxylate-specific signal transduction histidine kinase
MGTRSITLLGAERLDQSGRAALSLAVGFGVVFTVSVLLALWATRAVPAALGAVLVAAASAAGMAATTLREVRRRAAQAQRRQAERADLLRIITTRETVAEIAHGVNQPLTAIVNYAEGCLLQMKAGTLATDALVEMLNRIVAEGLQGGAIIRRLCGTVPSRPPRPEVVDVGDTAGEAVRIAEVAAERHGVSIRLKLDDAEPPAVWADRLELELGILGLLEAGIDAIWATQGRRSELFVETGEGKAATDRARVSTRLAAPFFNCRADGLGLGLRISRSIAESLGGELWGAADRAGSATFYLALPVKFPGRSQDWAAGPSSVPWYRQLTPVIAVHIPSPAGMVALAWASDDGLLRSGEGAAPGFESPKIGADATLEICADG